MHVARTVAEAHLFMDIAGCSAERAHQLVQRGDDLVSQYTGTVNGEERTFEFVVVTPELNGGAFGGREASTCLDPAQFLLWADALSRTVPADPTSLSAEERRLSAARLRRAAACVDEVLKFFAEDQERLGPDAFTTTTGKWLIGKASGRFTRARLAAVASTYRSLAERHEVAG